MTMTNTTRVDEALAFLDQTGRPVEQAWAGALFGRCSRDDALRELANYQNDDGGFGHGLEPDISAPDSHPFATRMAMLTLISLDAKPDEPIVRRLAGWLEASQSDDGCWRFASGVYEHPLAPWFAGWSQPSLNPALDLAGCAARLGIGSAQLQERVRTLFGKLATLDEARGGEFYNVLPYAEYVPWVAVPEQDAYLAALVDYIVTGAEQGPFEGGWQFFDLAGPAGGRLSRRLPASLIQAQLDRVQAEQQADGGWLTPYDSMWRSYAEQQSPGVWPNAYDAVWRSIVTADNLATLHSYGRLG